MSCDKCTDGVITVRNGLRPLYDMPCPYCEDKLELKINPEIQHLIYSINFTDNYGEHAGILYWEDDLLKFKGDLHSSAEVLFKYVCEMWNDKKTT